MIELLDERFALDVRARLLATDAPLLPLKRRWRVTDCKHRTPDYVDIGYPVVSPGDATPGRLDLSRCHRFVDEADLRDLCQGGREPRRGSIIYSRNASIGIASYIDTDERFCMGQDVCLISSADQNELYLTYALNSLGVDQLDETKIGSTFSRVNIAQIVELQIPCPTPEVQAQVAGDLELASDRHDHLTDRLARQIELLREHRQALITAAVTGELDVASVA